MKTRNLFLLTIIVILTASASSKPPEPFEKITPPTGMASQINPLLVGVKKVDVLVLFNAQNDNKPNQQEPILTKQVKAEAISQLMKAKISTNINIPLPNEPVASPENTLELRIDIIPVPIAGSDKYLFYIQTSIFAKIALEQNSSTFYNSNIWTAGATIETTLQTGVKAAVTSLAFDQVRSFIKDWRNANAPARKTTEVKKPNYPNESTDLTQPPTTIFDQINKPTTQNSNISGSYVASRKSRIFHKSECSATKGIKPANLITYNSREDAVKSRKKPCLKCKP